MFEKAKNLTNLLLNFYYFLNADPYQIKKVKNLYNTKIYL